MAREHGRNCLLKVGDGADPEVFTTLPGQRNTRATINGNPIDVTTKDDDGWGATITGTRQMTVTVEGIAEWPEPTIFQRMRQAARDGTVINVQVVYSSNGDMDEVPAYVTSLEMGGSNDSGTEYSATLQAYGEPTYTAGS